MDEFDIIDKPDKAMNANKASEFERLYGLLLLGFIILIFFNSGFFKVHKVMVTGNHAVTDEEVLVSARIKANQTLFQTNGEQIRANLMKDPRISSVQVHLQFPNLVAIRIRERTPFLLVSYLKNYLTVSADGVVLSGATQENGKLPVVTGIDCAHLQTGSAIKSPEFETARMIASTVDDRTRESLSEIDLKNYQLFLDLPSSDRTIKVELGNSRQLEVKLANLRAILMQTDLNNLEKIDLRTAESPTIISPNGSSKGLNSVNSGSPH